MTNSSVRMQFSKSRLFDWILLGIRGDNPIQSGYDRYAEIPRCCQSVEQCTGVHYIAWRNVPSTLIFGYSL